MHKSGFVTIIGNPNVGKSTLVNNLLGEKLSIITPKAQTTRHRLLGILSNKDYQIVFSDTPGVLKPKYKLQDAMMTYVKESLADSDLIIYIVDTDKNQLADESVQKILVEIDKKILILVNKIDLVQQDEVAEIVEFWQKKFNEASIFPISALNKFNLQIVLKTILKNLPEAPAYFPKDIFTDRSVRFIISEIIREKIFKRYTKEIPYSTEVVIESYKDSDKIVKINCIIYVERTSQKGIIIGKNGSALTSLGSSARRDIQNFLKKKVFLGLYIKVLKDWKKKNKDLKSFGYLKK
ncbi:MAG: GTPase Era [Flavobacteriales bacterium TMED113]|nr:MAG: GTPase Era [Flavobacteriales bacterium TMED113]